LHDHVLKATARIHELSAARRLAFIQAVHRVAEALLE
jgi:hypothetical protein